MIARVLQLIGLTALYYIVAKLGLDLATLNKSASPVWPASGLAIAILIFSGLRSWPAIFIGAFIINVLTQNSSLSAFLIAIGNTGEAVIATLIVNLIVSGRLKEFHFGSSFGFFIGGIVAPPVSATAGVLSLWITGQLTPDSFLSVWMTWWVGDALGILSVAPLLLAIRNRIVARMGPSWMDFFFIGLTCFVSRIAFRASPGDPLVFLAFIPLLVGASPKSTGRVFFLSTISMIFGICYTLQGKGPFAGGTTNQNLILLQIFLSSLALSALGLHRLARLGTYRIGRLILLCTWGLAAFIYVLFANEEKKKDAARLDALTTERTSAIQTRLDAYEEGIRSGAALYAASASVESHEWTGFVTNLNITERLPGIFGLGVAWKTPHRKLQAFEKSMKKEVPDYQVRPFPSTTPLDQLSPDQDLYIVKFIEPQKKNKAVQGLVISSEPHRRQAAELARDTGLSAVTSQVSLVQDAEKLPGFMLFFPIYKNGMRSRTVEERRAHILGWVFAPITWKSLLEGVLGPSHSQIDFEVIEKLPQGATHVLYDSNHHVSSQMRAEKFTTIRFGQREFQLIWNRGIDFQSAQNGATSWTGLIATILGFVISFIFSILQSMNQRVRSLANRAIADLRTSEEKFKAIIESVRDYSIIMIDPQGTIMTWNEGARLIQGYSSNEIVGRHFSLFFTQEDQSTGAPLRILEQAIQLTRYEDEGWRLRKNEVRFWAGLTVTPIFDFSEKLTGFTLIIRDLTAKKEAENEYEQLISILDASPDFIGIADMNGNLMYHNPAAKRLIGREETDFSKLQIKDMHPAWASRLVLQEGIPTVLEGRVWRKETALLHREGYEIPVSQALMVHCDQKGEPQYLSTIMRDITESQQRARQDALAQEIDRFLAIADSETETIHFVCKIITEQLKWKIGIFWGLNAERSLLKLQDSFSTGDECASLFLQGSRSFTFANGIGLPGRIWQSGTTTWLEDVREDSAFPRKALAEETGMCTGFGFPIQVENQFLGCFEFFSSEKIKLDRYLFDIFQGLQRRIAQRIQYLRSKAEAEQRYLILQSIIDGHPGPVQVRDLQGRFRLVNQALADSLGVSKEQLLGKTPSDFFPEEVANQAKREDQEVLLARESRFFEKEIEFQQGLRSLFVHKFPIQDREGADIGVCAITVDFTDQVKLKKELQHSNQWRRGILDSANSTIISTNRDGVIQTFNRRAEILLGYPAQEVIGKSIGIFHDSHEVEFRAEELSFELDQNIEPGFQVLLSKPRLGFVDEHEWTYIRKDGSRFPVLLTVTALLDENNEATGYLAIGTDITEKKKVEEQLRQKEFRTLEAVRSKERFLASMSHEIRTPLNGIIGMTDLLLETKLDDQQQDYARIVQQSGTSLLSLINDILDFSKIEAGKMELEKAEFSASNLIELQTEVLLARAKQKNLTLSTFASPELPRALIGDPGRIGQILLNLIGNGLKFTSTGGVSVRALYQKDRSSHEIARVRFEVEDTGIGLPEKAKNQLFQPFSQADDTVARKYGGTGLGLSICRRLVEQMGGEIGFESVEGKGAMFWFEIPFQMPRHESEQALSAGKDPTLIGLKVLILEQNQITRDAMARYLRSWQMRGDTVSTLDQAIELLHQAADVRDPYQILMVASGSSVKEISKIRKELKLRLKVKPKIVLTLEFGLNVSPTSLKRRGFANTLHKPIRQSQFYDCLVKTLHPQAQTTVPQQELEHCALPEHRPSQFRILVADDVVPNQLLAQKLLESLGYSVRIATNGLEVVELLGKMSFDLILMDCQMPELDGFEATARIRLLSDPEKRDIPIIALTANAMSGDDKKCYAAGMNDYLAKPIKKELLKAKLEQWLVLPRKS